MKFANGIALIALLTACSASAQSPVNRLQFQAPVTPAPGSWDASESNLGGLTFDFIYDLNRPVVAGSWIYQINGERKAFFFQTDMVYSTQAQAVQTGIIASFQGPTFVITGRADYVNPVYGGNGTAVPTNRTVRFEFVSSRVGTFIDNPGQPDERRFPIKASLRGLPLVAPTDYSGDWSVTSRLEATGAHRQFVGIVKLLPFTGPSTYRVEDQSAALNRPPSGVATPDADARRYAVACPAEDFDNPCETAGSCGLFCVSGSPVSILWMNANEVGSFQGATVQSTNTVFYDNSIDWPALVAYGDTDRIVLRTTRPAGGIVEMVFTRLPTGIYTQ